MRRASIIAGTIMLLAASAAPAAASHAHVRVLGSGDCVIIAEAGRESDVTLPEAVFARNPIVDQAVAYPDGRRHSIHVLVHIAGRGSGELYVLGSAADLANCADHVNG